MGCDIHLVLERKYGDRWIGMNAVEHVVSIQKDVKDNTFKQSYVWIRARERDYSTFAKLAGVRGKGPDPKGMPEDASELARVLYDYWEADGHSHSHCTLEEFLEAKAASVSNPVEVFLAQDHPARARPYEYFFGMYPPKDDEQYRVVFWFDN